MFCTICRKKPSCMQRAAGVRCAGPPGAETAAGTRPGEREDRRTIGASQRLARSPGPFLVKVVCEEAAQGRWTLHVVYGRDAQDDVPGLDPRAPVTDVCARCAVRQRRGARRVGRES